MLALAIPTIATALLTLSARVQAACYNVDGSEQNDQSFTACDPGAGVSACCANNKGSRSDLCLSSGLCYAQDGNFRGLLYMNGCTDESGSASECPHFCPDQTTNFNGGSPVKSWNVLQCNKGVFCCRMTSDTENCCSNSSALVTSDIGTLLVAATATTTISAATGAATTTSAAGTAQASDGDGATSTLTLPSSSSAPSSESEACPRDNTAVVGGAVGGVLGAALLASLGALMFVVKRRKDDSPASPQYPAYPQSSAYPPVHGYHVKPDQQNYPPAQELPGRERQMYEM
ncbi:hypothetical protein KVR01_002166 [Diaporthe batatas]|uniref:uncharacterized protein n=1 Tax=Diaporthe batatas TaxID=748121 RepID=UPI001D04BDDA|nr:uncharacterized protein KVR01_002166 [Diaporthe batatas]KAG8166477.1 hypothetical protein KVR01_002166 [Diaporthe batatas]